MKATEEMKRILEEEARARREKEEETTRARIEAIKASRGLSTAASANRSLQNVLVERFSIPHPSGKGDLLADATLSLTAGHRYGLVGKNGCGSYLQHSCG